MDDIINKSRAQIQKEDLRIAIPIIQSYNPKYILEIGTHRGGSCDLWLKTLDPELLITIDISKRGKIADSRVYYLSGVSSHTDEVLNKVKSKLGGHKLDMLFIDGDHSLDAVKADFEMYLPLVKQGGIIVLHDVIWYCLPYAEVSVYWKRIKHIFPYIEIAMNNNSSGVGIILNDKFERTELGSGI